MFRNFTLLHLRSSAQSADTIRILSPQSSRALQEAFRAFHAQITQIHADWNHKDLLLRASVNSVVIQKFKEKKGWINEKTNTHTGGINVNLMLRV